MDLLIGEDERINQLYLQHLLRDKNLNVAFASNGRVALDLATSRAFDLLLLDIHMPEIDGVEICRRIREGVGATARETPVIAMTALVRDGERERLLASGFTAVLSKPFDDSDLLQILDSYSQGAE